jgi:dTMP kinase
MYIALEGIDTCGKSTQILELKRYFKEALFTCEPGGTKIGSSIRDIVLNGNIKSSIAEMFLFLADRAEHTQEILQKSEQNLIISDRSLVSGIAYANIFEFELLKKLNLLATQNIVPDLVVLLKLNRQELECRLNKKQSDSIEQRGVEYLMNIQDKIAKISQKLGIELLVIDASKDINSITSTIIKNIRT